MAKIGIISWRTEDLIMKISVPKPSLYLYFSFCIYCKNPMHIMHYFYHEKTSKKSPKSFLMDEKDAPSCPRVAFTPLKLLRNPLKVTPGHPKSYSRTGSKFAISSGFYSIFTPSKNSYFNTPDSNCQNNNTLGKTTILTFIREQQIFRGKYALVEHE